MSELDSEINELALDIQRQIAANERRLSEVPEFQSRDEIPQVTMDDLLDDG